MVPKDEGGRRHTPVAWVPGRWLRFRPPPKALPTVDDPAAGIIVTGVVGAGVDADELVDEDDGEPEDGELASPVFATAVFVPLFRGRYR